MRNKTERREREEKNFLEFLRHDRGIAALKAGWCRNNIISSSNICVSWQTAGDSWCFF